MKTTSVQRRLGAVVAATAIVLAGLTALPQASSAELPAVGPPHEPTHELWQRVTGPIPESHQGKRAAIEVDAFRAFRLDHDGIAAALELAALELAVPAPGGRLERFAVVESPVMEPGLAARHPEIATYRGRGITDPTATIRLSLTPLGFHASVRGRRGTWYVDPYYHLDRSLYVSYFARDARNPRGAFFEELEGGPDDHDHLDDLQRLAGGLLSGHDADAARSSGDVLRVYRLALATDPTYAEHFNPDGTQPENVPAAKVALVNRVVHIYEDELSITMLLINDNDRLSFDTDELATGADGPCGSAPCYTTALLYPAPSVGNCPSTLLSRNRIVLGQVVGASNFDIGHLVVGTGNGGRGAIASVGRDEKARGCTALTPPQGDRFAVDFVAHEMGHQFAGNHTFNGTGGTCSTARWGPTSVEPGSGSSIMAYAGICPSSGGGNNLQSNTDPYFSQRSHEEIIDYVTSAQDPIDEVQTISLRGFDTDGDSFTLTFGGNTSPAIVRGTNYTEAGIQAALASILPAGAVATVAGWGGAALPFDAGFEVSFGGTLAATDVGSLTVTNTSGMSGFVGETAKGGPVDNGGVVAVGTGNSAPAVNAPGPFTIPYQTPFALTGSASDPDGDALTYLWEQNDPGASAVSLRDPNKTTGPLFRQFATGLDASVYDPDVLDSPGLNHPTDDPTRVFPDMAQLLANTTNAESGDCAGSEEELIECYSEFLPTPVYPGPMQFRLTARDGNGGVDSADTTVDLAAGTGPFLVTSPNTAVTWLAGSTPTVTWDVAGTATAPVGTTAVDILLSTDGGATFPHVLAAGTPNDGTEPIVVPDTETTAARLMVRAVGNIFFDVSNSDFEIVGASDMELVSKTASQDPAFAGETLTYAIRARNNGPSRAQTARVVDVIPPGTTYTSSSIPCLEFPTRRLTCALGGMDAGDETTFTITVSITRDLVHQAGAPVTITNNATVSSERDDPDPSNDQQTEATLVKAKADLAIDSFAPVNAPTELLIGEHAVVSLRGLVTNRGPSAPMDAKLVHTAASPPNASVSPTFRSSVAAALGFEEQRASSEEFEIACTQPGPATFRFTIDIAPDRPDDADPDPSNNRSETVLTVDCIVPVALNIQPGSSEKPINLQRNGDITVAVLTTEAGEYGLPLAFDATAIDALSARFGPQDVVVSGGGARESHDRGHIEDAVERSDDKTRDGDLDMVLHFRTRQSALTGTEVEACVRGRFGPDGYLFYGCDAVTFVP